MTRKVIATTGLVLLAGLLGIQLVPYGRDHANPPVTREPDWPSPDTRQLVRRACFDCHSNETSWPWYTSVAPASWLAQRDVVEGRRELNFSEWHRPQKEAREAARTVGKGKMPPRIYGLLHPEARLTPAERATLVGGLEAMSGRKGR